jgi:glycosyltransferase involved in cell wall biosynthesis
MKKLAIIVTHPIQYYSPLFRKINESGKIELKVFYTWSQAQGKKYDPGFGKEVDWDIPLLEGYDYTFVNNITKKPGSNHFNGIANPTLIKEIEEWNADAVLIIGWNFNSHLKAMRYFKDKIPVYFRGDSTLLDERSELKRIARRIFLRWVYSNIDFAFYVGTRNKEYFLVHGLKEEQLIFAPHAIDNERFYDKDGIYKQKAIEWRRSLGIKDDYFVFIFAGKLEPKKNPMLLLKAFLELKISNANLIFVGNGVLEEELKSIVTLRQAQCDNHSNIHFLPFQNQSIMPIVYRLGNVFVLPSQGPGETWGLAVNESMACELPVIVSDKVGCSVDLVEHDKNGYIFKSNDEKELMKVINLCIDKWKNDKNKFDEMGLNSLKMIQEYSMDVLAENIVSGVLKNNE